MSTSQDSGSLKNKPNPSIVIDSLDSEGRGVGRKDGKVFFVNYALPGEEVEYTLLRNKKNYAIADAVRITHPSPLRVQPHCPYFGRCGGCSLQHMEFGAQVAMKQKNLEDALMHIGGVKAEQMLPPIYGIAQHYRHRMRLSVKYVAKKQSVLVGFREKNHPFVMQMNQCPNLPIHVSKLIEPLKNLIGQLDCYDQIAQIECAVGEDITVMVLRNMVPLSIKDEKVIKAFVDQHQSIEYPLQIWLQPGKEDSMTVFYPLEMVKLHYRLPEFDLNMPFHPAEFTQVNPAVNQLMVTRAVRFLDIQPQDKVVDFFCGLGNFSLAIAKKGAQVLGVEGSCALVKRAEENAKLNQLEKNCQFIEANLFKWDAMRMDEWRQYNKWLIDPPRDGACTLLEALPVEGVRPRRIVYISCKPATLARDAGILEGKGYRLKMAGVMNMFAHTTHVESIAVFETK